MLGMMYAEGKGVTKDLVQAHAWLTIGRANHMGFSSKTIPQVEEAMTPEQKTEAAKLARELSVKFKRK